MSTKLLKGPADKRPGSITTRTGADRLVRPFPAGGFTWDACRFDDGEDAHECDLDDEEQAQDNADAYLASKGVL